MNNVSLGVLDITAAFGAGEIRKSCDWGMMYGDKKCMKLMKRIQNQMGETRKAGEGIKLAKLMKRMKHFKCLK